MNMIEYLPTIFCIILTLTVSWFTLKPFTLSDLLFFKYKENEDIFIAEAERRDRALNDLELDLSLGNVTQTDFDELRRDILK